MPRIRTLTPGASPNHFFGSEVRRAREAAGMSQAELGALVPCDKSVVSRIEARPGPGGCVGLASTLSQEQSAFLNSRGFSTGIVQTSPQLVISSLGG
jgi:hypothetical protein